jgi:pilus assembly protein CpaC
MDHSDMLNRGKTGLPWSSVCLVVLFLTAARPSVAWSQGRESLTSANFEVTQAVQQLEMIAKTSRIVKINGRIPKFQVHNEELLSATPVAENQIQLFAKAPGTTQINLWDTEDRHYTIDVTVVADARMVEGILSSQLPFASLRVTPLGESAIIAGTVTSVEDVDRAVAMVEQFYTTGINNIRVVGVQQVLLHTKIMEVSRTKLRDLGIDWRLNGSHFSISAAPGKVAFPGAEARIDAGDFSTLLAALRRDSLIKLLAEPTVVATHGRPARFSVGGKVPYIVPGGNGFATVEYEEYGTSVDMLPFVVGPGRIRLEVRPEVSEPDASRGIVTGGVTVTAFTSRYVETAVEMQSGQTFAIAGLLQSRTESSIEKIPLLGEIPYVGALFRRVQDRQNEVELLITVTPEFVEAMDYHEVPCGGPGLSTMHPTDKELYGKGYIEVPNLYGDCGCIGGAGTSFGGSHLLTEPSMNHQRQQRHGELIYPGPSPQVIGEGVTVMGPAN